MTALWLGVILMGIGVALVGAKFLVSSGRSTRRIRWPVALGVVAGYLLVTSPSQAGIILSDGSQQGNRSNFGGTVGTRFTLGSAGLVATALGYEDPGADGLQSAHQVGLWNDAGTLLASVTVPAGTGGTFIDGWRYVAISPTQLIAGLTYVLGAQVFDGIDAWSDSEDSNGNGTPDFSYSSFIGDTQPTNVFSGASFGFPNNDGFGTDLRWAPANAIAASVPEPSTVVLLGLGGIALTVYRRRQRING